MARITKVEVAQANLRRQLSELRTQLEACRTQLDSSKAQLKGLTTTLDSRAEVMKRAKELSRAGHYVVVRGNELTDYGLRRH
jgi:uncharacterized coiled-coil protein SlyX